jgi:hypothetical protein
LDALREQFGELGFYACPDVQKEEFGEPFEKYLDMDMFDESQLVFVEKPALRSCHVNAASVKLARVLTGRPASEAAAERAISIFEFIFDRTRMSSGIDVIRAQLMIRFWRINHPGHNPRLDCAVREAPAGKKQ